MDEVLVQITEIVETVSVTIIEAAADEVSVTISDASVTKVNVEAVLTGDISTHTHSIYLTREQIEGMMI